MSYRVVQWGTGNIGYQSLRHVIRHPDYELVGLHTFSPEKIGKDAAEIANLPAWIVALVAAGGLAAALSTAA